MLHNVRVVAFRLTFYFRTLLPVHSCRNLSHEVELIVNSFKHLELAGNVSKTAVFVV